jgi:hypothetical protein
MGLTHGYIRTLAEAEAPGNVADGGKMLASAPDIDAAAASVSGTAKLR